MHVAIACAARVSHCPPSATVRFERFFHGLYSEVVKCSLYNFCKKVLFKFPKPFERLLEQDCKS